MDWKKEGYDDAVAGNKLNRNAVQKCSVHLNYDSTANSYSDGYALGLEKFCTESNGRHFGSLGNRYKETCPLILEKKFLAGYTVGKQDYEEAEKERKRLEAQQRKYENLTPGESCTNDLDCNPIFSCMAMTCQPT